jgi:hypothetical protein
MKPNFTRDWASFCIDIDLNEPTQVLKGLGVVQDEIENLKNKFDQNKPVTFGTTFAGVKGEVLFYLPRNSTKQAELFFFIEKGAEAVVEFEELKAAFESVEVKPSKKKGLGVICSRDRASLTFYSDANLIGGSFKVNGVSVRGHKS